jgi:hypothetical protein
MKRRLGRWRTGFPAPHMFSSWPLEPMTDETREAWELLERLLGLGVE